MKSEPWWSQSHDWQRLDSFNTQTRTKEILLLCLSKFVGFHCAVKLSTKLKRYGSQCFVMTVNIVVMLIDYCGIRGQVCWWYWNVLIKVILQTTSEFTDDTPSKVIFRSMVKKDCILLFIHWWKIKVEYHLKIMK